MANALLRAAVFLLLAMLPQVTAGEPAPSEETDAQAYNLGFRIASRDPVRLLFASRDKGSGYVLELAARQTLLSRLDGGKPTRLALASQGCLSGEPRDIAVKRRPGVIRVECGGRPLLRAYDGRYDAGSASFALLPAGARVTNLRLQPIGEVECGDDFLPDSRVAAEWRQVAGRWSVDSYRDPMMGEDQGPVGASWITARGSGPCSFVGGEEFWEDLALQVTARAIRGKTVGLLFNYRDARNYGLFRVSEGKPGAVAIEEVAGGKRRTVAQAAWAGDLAWWRRLRVETAGTFARTFVDGAVVLRGNLSAGADGRVGLFADGGTEALFDDLSVHSFSLLYDALRTDLDGWRRDGGQWKASARGLTVRPASRALASPATSAWADLSASLKVDPAPGTEAGLAFRASGKDACYSLTLLRQSGGGKWLLKRVAGKQAQVLASAPAAERAGWRKLAIRAVGGRLQAYGDDTPLPAVYDFSYREGPVILVADGHRPASFTALEVAGPVRDPTASLTEVDFAQERVRGLNKPNGQFEFLRPLGDLLEPTSAAWTHDLKAGVLRARAGGALWYWDSWEGDMGIAVTVAGAGNSGLLLCGDGRNPDSGYRLALDGKGGLVLHRKGKPAARATVSAGAAKEPTRLELRRDGTFIVGGAGETRVAFRETEPIEGGRAGVWSGGGGPAFDDLSVWLDHTASTPFDRVDTDWRPASGEWLLHSGMTCIPWTYWLAADGRKEPALMWYQNPIPRDFELLFRVSEHSEGNQAGEHGHFPYHDIRLVLHGSPADASRGYTLLLGADRGKTTRLLRNGQVVAESRKLTIEMGGHCNEPRQVHVRLRRQGGNLRVWTNGSPLLSYDDPQPLAGGQAALGLTGCRANFRDFILSANRTWLPGGDWRATADAR